MIPNPIRKVLSTTQKHNVRALLMGGQACVLYGAAEFSRDTDLALTASDDNLARLQNALDELGARVIAVPPFRAEYLERGHAVHFRCNHPDAENLRIDVMAKMRGVAPFEELWERRTTVEIETESLQVLALPDLVRAKKTQRDKDWPMIRRLLEVHHLEFRAAPTPERVEFWLRELRTPSLLREIARLHPKAFQAALPQRRALQTLAHDDEETEAALREEEDYERRLDRAYWQPLKSELEALRHRRA